METFNSDSALYGHPDELLVYGKLRCPFNLKKIKFQSCWTFSEDSLDVNGDVTFEKPLSVTDTEGIGLQLLEEKGVLLSTENFPPIRSLTLTNNVKVILN